MIEELKDMKARVEYAESAVKEKQARIERMEKENEDEGLRSRMKSWLTIQTGILVGAYFCICASYDWQGLNLPAHPSLLGTILGLWGLGYGVGVGTKWGK